MFYNLLTKRYQISFALNVISKQYHSNLYYTLKVSN